MTRKKTSAEIYRAEPSQYKVKISGGKSSSLFTRSWRKTDLVWFYGISTITGYLYPNLSIYLSIYIYIYIVWYS